MRAYLQLFFSLLVPLSGLFIVASVIYFHSEYSFTNAMRLGVLSGFFIAIAVSLFTALFLLIMRSGKPSQKTISKRQTKVPSHKIQKQTHDTSIERENSTTPASVIPLAKQISSEKTIKQQMMLLMDKALALEVLLHAVKERAIGQLTENGQITVKNGREIIKFSISSLTRHTAEVIITSKINSKAAKTIIHYMKEKEHSFLQY